MMFIFSFLLFLPKIICGFALVHWLWNEIDIASITLKAAIGVPLGLAISSSIFFSAVLLGIPPKTYSLLEFLGFLVAAILVVLHFLNRSKINFTINDSFRQDYLSTVILIFGFGLLVYVFMLYSRMHPHGFEDAWNIWNYTSRFIYRTNSPVIFFESKFYDVFHPDYPPGLSLNVAWGWLVLNSETTRIPIAIALYTIVSPALILWAAIKKWKGSLSATLAALVYLMSANLTWSVAQLADTVLALYILSSVVMFYYYLRTLNNRLLLVAGLLTGYSAWIKNEGILFILVSLLIFTMMALRRVVNWDSIKWLGSGIFIPIIILITYKLTINVPSDLFSGNNSFTAQILDFQRWLTIGSEFFAYTLRYGNWPISIILVLLAYMILVGFDRSEHQRQIWLFLIIAMQLMGYFGIYLVTPHDLTWHIYTSLERVISHAFPSAIFWVFITVQNPDLTLKNQLKNGLSNY